MFAVGFDDNAGIATCTHPLATIEVDMEHVSGMHTHLVDERRRMWAFSP